MRNRFHVRLHAMPRGLAIDFMSVRGVACQPDFQILFKTAVSSAASAKPNRIYSTEFSKAPVLPARDAMSGLSVLLLLSVGTVGLGFGRDTNAEDTTFAGNPCLSTNVEFFLKGAWGIHGSHELRVEGRIWFCLHCRRRGPLNREGQWHKRCC